MRSCEQKRLASCHQTFLMPLYALRSFSIYLKTKLFLNRQLCILFCNKRAEQKKRRGLLWDSPFHPLHMPGTHRLSQIYWQKPVVRLINDQRENLNYSTSPDLHPQFSHALPVLLRAVGVWSRLSPLPPQLWAAELHSQLVPPAVTWQLLCLTVEFSAESNLFRDLSVGFL